MGARCGPCARQLDFIRPTGRSARLSVSLQNQPFLSAPENASARVGPHSRPGELGGLEPDELAPPKLRLLKSLRTRRHYDFEVREESVRLRY
jgi:hypothetical protein